MKLNYLFLLMLATTLQVRAQDDVYPAKEYKGLLFITNGTVHIGNGQVLEKATVEVRDGKIVGVGANIAIPQGDVKVFDVTGKHVYPGLILPQSDLGLKEIAAGVRGSNDYRELGELNPNIRSIVAYNTASMMINILKTNGVLLANVVPQGGIISGSSSVVQLDAWNYEDAAYKQDGAIHVTIPPFSAPRSRFAVRSGPPVDYVKVANEKIEEVKDFFRQGKAYLEKNSHAEVNLKFEALRGLFDKQQALFVHAGSVSQMLAAIELVKEFGFRTVLVGASESWQIAPLLKENNIGVILGAGHSLPGTEDEDIDQPFKTPAVLQNAGVLFALSDDATNTRYRNLPFNAGTAASYGLTKEQALSAITLNAAQLLGIADRTGSLEAGKDANIVVSEGDILDMKTSIITHAFIQGRQVSLENKQTQLNERYLKKYGLQN
ncbi:MAG: amidohydrolase family protein [Chitinophagaceae bacterium]|nr:amidohydrolase family protein [Chitinophagaceae bacterium]MCW5928587.1 amidohydrolase family protein [Chitinophagaceae bacterium]